MRSPSNGDPLFSFRERIHDISCHGHERESVLLPWLAYCSIERRRVCTCVALTTSRVNAFAVVENGIESSSAANIRVIGIIHKFSKASKYMPGGVNE